MCPKGLTWLQSIPPYFTAPGFRREGCDILNLLHQTNTETSGKRFEKQMKFKEPIFSGPSF